jgi:hypothetical protein
MSTSLACSYHCVSVYSFSLAVFYLTIYVQSQWNIIQSAPLDTSILTSLQIKGFTLVCSTALI